MGVGQQYRRATADRDRLGRAQQAFVRPHRSKADTLGALGNLGSIRRRDFVTGALLVADMEMAALRGLRVARLLLHPQLTEIALAGGIPTLFTELATRAARQGMEAGIVTHNPVRAATVLGADLTHFPVVIAPCNPRGYKMFPDREACEQLFRSDPGRFFADELTAGGSVPVETALAHVQELGLAGAVLDVRAVETAYREGGLGVGTATGAV